MSDVDDLIKKVVAFRDARDWKQFHPPKELAIALSIETGELLEHFRWKTREEVAEYIKSHKEGISDEYADILYLLLLFANEIEIDPIQALDNKLKKIGTKYPISKAKGKHTKYTEL